MSCNKGIIKDQNEKQIPEDDVTGASAAAHVMWSCVAA